MKASEVLHVVPIRDLVGHTLSCPCACGPRNEADGAIVVHNSFDRREAWEKMHLPDADKPWGVFHSDGTLVRDDP
jgi:hypothetical protein